MSGKGLPVGRTAGLLTIPFACQELVGAHGSPGISEQFRNPCHRPDGSPEHNPDCPVDGYRPHQRPASCPCPVFSRRTHYGCQQESEAPAKKCPLPAVGPLEGNRGNVISRRLLRPVSRHNDIRHAVRTREQPDDFPFPAVSQLHQRGSSCRQAADFLQTHPHRRIETPNFNGPGLSRWGRPVGRTDCPAARDGKGRGDQEESTETGGHRKMDRGRVRRPVQAGDEPVCAGAQDDTASTPSHPNRGGSLPITPPPGAGPPATLFHAQFVRGLTEPSCFDNLQWYILLPLPASRALAPPVPLASVALSTPFSLFS